MRRASRRAEGSRRVRAGGGAAGDGRGGGRGGGGGGGFWWGVGGGGAAPPAPLFLPAAPLGTPGGEPAPNRHNVGWMVVEELARRHGASWRSKFNGQLSELRLDGHRVALLKPETFMNESGRSVGAAARFFKLEPDAILVVHDEIDLDRGRLQARSGGGLTRPNTPRSSAPHPTTPRILRLRGGVCRPRP